MTTVKMKEVMLAAALFAFPAFGQDAAQSPDPAKVSYAFGMNLGLQIKQMGADVDVDAIAKAIKDVQDGRPTKLQASELPAIFKQEEEFARSQTSARNKADGAAFLAKNASSAGVTVLTDGLQYRVLSAGDGPTPKLSDAVELKYRGTLTDGTEFTRNDHLRATVASQMRGWQEALQLMKVGAKWQIFLPPNLAYGRNWLRKVGPESTVIFEIELLAITPVSTQVDGPRVIPQ